MIKQKLNMLREIIKKNLLKDELDQVTKDTSALMKQVIFLESRMIVLEKDNAELKEALGNLSVAYLELVETLPSQRSIIVPDNKTIDEYLDTMLKLFISEQSDDDLIN